MTNIFRMEALLCKPPQVSDVGRCLKGFHKPVFDTDGRCRGHKGDGHQSPFGLRVTLTASGATMVLGCGVNRIKADSMALWWHPFGHFTAEDQDKMVGIFGDVTEVVHLTPAGEAFQPAKAEQAEDFLRYALATVPDVRSTMAPEGVAFLFCT